MSGDEEELVKRSLVVEVSDPNTAILNQEKDGWELVSMGMTGAYVNPALAPRKPYYWMLFQKSDVR